VAFTVYEVKTNLPPEAVNALGLEIFTAWVEFAMGQRAVDGKMLAYPTGRYASSISYRREGEATVAIIADEAVAPAARWIEEGHGEVDLKAKLEWGRGYPMHREQLSRPVAGLRRRGGGMADGKPSMWATARAADVHGFASIGPDSPADSWIIPAMPAYHPARTFAALARAQAQIAGSALGPS